MSKSVVVIGAFDNLRSKDVRLLEEAAKIGLVTVLLWPDETIRACSGSNPKFPLAERTYFLEAVRFVARVIPLRAPHRTNEPVFDDFKPAVWVDEESQASDQRRDYCRQQGVEYHVLPAQQLIGFPEQPPAQALPGRKKIVVTGCYDWLHSGHVRFFQEVSEIGELYVIVGHDANIRLLKGAGHPLQPQEERRYMAGAIRYVTQVLISSGDGWLDAEPEIQRIKPDIYAVNEDGDRGGKREFCAKIGIDYLVLKRAPAPGLPPRSSTDLRGF